MLDTSVLVRCYDPTMRLSMYNLILNPGWADPSISHSDAGGEGSKLRSTQHVARK